MLPERRGGGLGDDGLDTTSASILAAYFALRVERVAGAIGTREIATFLTRHWPARAVPSDSVIQRALVAAALPHRGRGQPSRASRALDARALEPHETAVASPLLPVRPQVPRLRGPK
jgi:hypothetical protein